MDSIDPSPIDPSWFKNGLRFKCTGCGKCCTGSGGYVFISPSDLSRLSAHLSLSKQEFTQKYTRQVDGLYALLDKENGDDCIFLENKQCTVYEARPIQCKTFPWWIHNLRFFEDWEEAKQRCEGIDHQEADLVSSSEIQEECNSYLDNLLEQHFNL